jgi:hypothetical protein
MSKAYKDFGEFWPFYIREHSKKGTRALHFVGTTSLFIFTAVAILNRSIAAFLCGIISAYACAWIGHFVVEKNRPATFQYPLLSLLGDFKMYGLMLTGRMKDELKRTHTGPA